MRKTPVILLIFIMTIQLVGCDTKAEEESIDNIFEHAVSLENDCILANQAQYGTTSEAILEDLELSSEAYIGESIINEITVDTLTEVVTEKYIFEDDKLVSIEYWITMDKETTGILLEQAKAYMPSTTVSGSGDATEGDSSPIVWVDEDGNQCELLLGDDTFDSSVQYAMLKLSTARNLDEYSNGLAQDTPSE